GMTVPQEGGRYKTVGLRSVATAHCSMHSGVAAAMTIQLAGQSGTLPFKEYTKFLKFDVGRSPIDVQLSGIS
ncbi:MAG: hypothetical protein ACN4GF_07595, partial [Lentimonas sp.]